MNQKVWLSTRSNEQVLVRPRKLCREIETGGRSSKLRRGLPVVRADVPTMAGQDSKIEGCPTRASSSVVAIETLAIVQDMYEAMPR
jgi:hypothetical protein